MKKSSHLCQCQAPMRASGPAGPCNGCTPMRATLSPNTWLDAHALHSTPSFGDQGEAGGCRCTAHGMLSRLLSSSYSRRSLALQLRRRECGGSCMCRAEPAAPQATRRGHGLAAARAVACCCCYLGTQFRSGGMAWVQADMAAGAGAAAGVEGGAGGVVDARGAA
jgi:hypothetical protein